MTLLLNVYYLITKKVSIFDIIWGHQFWSADKKKLYSTKKEKEKLIYQVTVKEINEPICCTVIGTSEIRSIRRRLYQTYNQRSIINVLRLFSLISSYIIPLFLAILLPSLVSTGSLWNKGLDKQLDFLELGKHFDEKTSFIENRFKRIWKRLQF